jgi:hypothetical protein
VFPQRLRPTPLLLSNALRLGGDAGAAERTRFQPLEVGMIKIDGIPVWILKLLPTEHLRTASACCLLEHYHLHRTRNVARFSDAHDAKYGFGLLNTIRFWIPLACGDFPARQARFDALQCQGEKKPLLIHLRVVGCSIQCIRSTPRLKEAINKIIWNSNARNTSREAYAASIC